MTEHGSIENSSTESSAANASYNLTGPASLANTALILQQNLKEAVT